MSGLFLLTPTGHRPEAFALCERWMQKQTFQDWTWLVSDDGEPKTSLRAGQVQVPVSWTYDGTNTQSLGMTALLTFALECGADTVAVIEDDEWYGPLYLETMMERLRGYHVVGEGLARYYSLRTRQFKIHRNRAHACLARTVMTRRWIKNMLEVFSFYESRHDIEFWRKVGRKGLVLAGPRLSVGIKGMPGRAGIGAGHNGDERYESDPDGAQLRGWLGADAAWYLPYLGEASLCTSIPT